jgi:hypothetical protein
VPLLLISDVAVESLAMPDSSTMSCDRDGEEYVGSEVSACLIQSGFVFKTLAPNDARNSGSSGASLHVESSNGPTDALFVNASARAVISARSAGVMEGLVAPHNASAMESLLEQPDNYSSGANNSYVTGVPGTSVRSPDNFSIVPINRSAEGQLSVDNSSNDPNGSGAFTFIDTESSPKADSAPKAKGSNEDTDKDKPSQKSKESKKSSGKSGEMSKEQAEKSEYRSDVGLGAVLVIMVVLKILAWV